MWIYRNFVNLMVISYITGDQYRYIFEHDKFVFEYLDNNLVNASANLYDLKESKALNATFTLKIELPDDFMFYGSAVKWIGTRYGPALIQVSKSIKDALEMTIFDLDKFITRTFRPPLIWPIEKGKTYHTAGWTPDVTKFPPNLPPGKWKVVVDFTFGNKSKLATVGWYLKIVYKH